MKKTYEELCAALEGEEIELNVKLEHLEHFMMSEDFQGISERQKGLLTRQLEAMRMYKGALIARVMQARFEHEQNKGRDCEPEPEEEEPAEKADVPEIPCVNCKHFIYTGPHEGKCNSAVQCAKGSEWEAL